MQSIEIRWTSGSLDEARAIARHLVMERLVACAQIVPWVESIFLWNEKLDTVQETKVILKTELRLYDQVKNAIQEKCSYEIPEISYVLIDGVNQEYEKWMTQVLSHGR